MSGSIVPRASTVTSLAVSDGIEGLGTKLNDQSAG